MVDAGDSDHLHAGAAEEGFVGHVDFAAVDLALDDLQPDLALHQLDHGAAGDAFQHVGIDRRRDQRVAAHEEEVLGAAFRHVPVLVEHNRLGKAVEHRLALDQRAVDIAADDLAAWGERRVVDAAPTAHADLRAFFVLDVAAKGRAENRHSSRRLCSRTPITGSDL